jgi:hypothetical protein
VANLAELSGSVSVSNLPIAAVSHFCNLEGFPSPFSTPRFSKILRGIKNFYSKPVRPKKHFRKDDIIRFMNLARVGNLMDWRAAFPMALCYQQLLRGAECFDLNGSNMVRGMNAFQVVVETLKNHPEGFEFSVPIDRERLSCVDGSWRITLLRWASGWATLGPSSRVRWQRAWACGCPSPPYVWSTPR